MDMSFVPDGEYVRFQIPILGVLIHMIAELGDSGLVVHFSLNIGLRVVRCCEHVLDPRDVTCVIENRKANFLPMSGNIMCGGPWAMTQWVTNAFATRPAVTALNGTVWTLWQKRFIILKRYALFREVSTSSPKISMPTSFNRVRGGNMFMYFLCRWMLMRFSAQVTQLCTVS